MANEQNGDISSAALLENILDQAYLEDGMTPDELRQNQVIAQIEMHLVANGRSIKDIYSEWEQRTPAEIVSQYFYLLETERLDRTSASITDESIGLTGELHVSVAGFKQHPLTGVFWINDPVTLPSKVLVFRLSPSLRGETEHLQAEQPVMLRLGLHKTNEGQEIFVNEITREKVSLPTFPSADPKPYPKHYSKR